MKGCVVFIVCLVLMGLGLMWYGSLSGSSKEEANNAFGAIVIVLIAAGGLKVLWDHLNDNHNGVGYD